MADRIIFILTVMPAVVYLYARSSSRPWNRRSLGPKAFPRLLGKGLMMTGRRAPGRHPVGHRKPGGQRRKKGSGTHRHYLVVVAEVILDWHLFRGLIRLGYAIATTVTCWR